MSCIRKGVYFTIGEKASNERKNKDRTMPEATPEARKTCCMWHQHLMGTSRQADQEQTERYYSLFHRLFILFG